MTDHQRINRLKKLIELEMNECNTDAWPKVCQMQSTPEGYQKIERYIISIVKKESLPIATCIALLEQELSHSTDL